MISLFCINIHNLIIVLCTCTNLHSSIINFHFKIIYRNLKNWNYTKVYTIASSLSEKLSKESIFPYLWWRSNSWVQMTRYQWSKRDRRRWLMLRQRPIAERSCSACCAETRKRRVPTPCWLSAFSIQVSVITERVTRDRFHNRSWETPTEFQPFRSLNVDSISGYIRWN